MRRLLFLIPLFALTFPTAAAELRLVETVEGCRFYTGSKPGSYKTASWSGQCVNKLADGAGVLRAEVKKGAKVRFAGTMEKGHMNGHWSMRWSKGRKVLKYVGQIRDGVRNGQGILVSPKGTITIGEFARGYANGETTFLFKNGDIYRGNVMYNHFHGNGTLTRKNGTVLKGWFITNRLSGPATIRYPEKGTYKGYMDNDKFHGKGKRVYASGDHYDGQWYKGRRHGTGICFTKKTGKSEPCTFEHGKRI